MWYWIRKALGLLAGVFTGGTLSDILDTIEHKIDSETEKEKVKAEVTKTWINAQAQLLVGRTWWFQLFFVLPLGFWWTCIIIDSVFMIEGWEISKLPSPLDSWAGGIISALFMIDAGKALVGRLKR